VAGTTAERPVAPAGRAAGGANHPLVAIAVRTQPFEQLVLDFLAYLEFERGLSRNTLDAYRSDLQQFGAHLERTGGDALAAGPDDLAAFVALLAGGDGERPPVAPAPL
jgi:integrase/recombinase XerD